jgi:hypothetical protein
MPAADLLKAMLVNRVFGGAPGWNDDQWRFAEPACTPQECAQLFRQGLITAEPVHISDELLAVAGQRREDCGPLTHEWTLTAAGREMALAHLRQTQK